MTPAEMEAEARRRASISREVNTVHQLIHNWKGETLTQERAGRIDRHLSEVRRLLRECPGVHPPKWRSREQREAREAFRREVLARYGGACVCCGEPDPRVLTIDHVKPLRGKPRRDVYRWLRAHGYPTGRHQVLCLNCNMLKGTGASCTHGAEG